MLGKSWKWYNSRQTTFVFSVEILLLISVTLEADALVNLKQESPPLSVTVSEGTVYFSLECIIAGGSYNWYHHNIWLYNNSGNPATVVRKNNLLKEDQYQIQSLHSSLSGTYGSRLTIKEVQASTNGLFECANNETNSSDPAQVFLIVPSRASSLLISIDGESPQPNTAFDVEEGEHIVQCTAAGFNPKSTDLNVRLLFKGKAHHATAESREVDTESAAAVKADRFRAVWNFTVMVESFDSGKQLSCQETLSFKGSCAVRLNLGASGFNLRSLLMTIDGDSPSPNTTLNVREGEHTVQCTAVGFFTTTTQLDIQLFLGNQSQPVSAKPHEVDNRTVTTRATWNFTVLLNTSDSGKRLVCKETVSSVAVRGIRLNVLASDDPREEGPTPANPYAPGLKNKLSLTTKAAIALSIGAPALLGTFLFIARYCRNIGDLLAFAMPCLQCCRRRDTSPSASNDFSSQEQTQTSRSTSDINQNPCEA